MTNKTSENGGNLPTWAGAAYCYSKAYRILEKLSKTAPHLCRMPGSNRRRGSNSYSVIACSDDMQEMITALNKGDEEQIKWLNMRHDRLLQ